MQNQKVHISLKYYIGRPKKKTRNHKKNSCNTTREIKTETRTYQSQQQVPGAMKLVPVPFLGKLSHFSLEEIKSDTFSFGCLCHTYFPKRREEKNLHERARSKKKAI
jgi:hypothetical protein